MVAFRFSSAVPSQPPAERRIFCDGTADPTFREGVDVELSHWIPNRTPRRYKADTSTGICLAFVADPLPGEWGLAINNHVDTDGVLSAFAITHPGPALAHRQVLVEAAAMGDFMGWGGERAQRLYQGLGWAKTRLSGQRVEPQALYERCFEEVEALLGDEHPLDAVAEAGVAALRESSRLLESGAIERRLVHERLAAYSIPRGLAEPSLERATRVPGFDALLSRDSLLLPQARARLDAQRIQLVSTAVGDGWLHDVWLPGYVWAETPDSWRPAGLVASDADGHRLETPAWGEAARELQQREAGSGRWELASHVTPFETLKGRGFPVVLSCLRRAKPVASRLDPGTVAEVLLQAGIAGD